MSQSLFARLITNVEICVVVCSKSFCAKPRAFSSSAVREHPLEQNTDHLLEPEYPRRSGDGPAVIYHLQGARDELQARAAMCNMLNFTSAPKFMRGVNCGAKKGAPRIEFLVGLFGGEVHPMWNFITGAGKHMSCV